MPKNHTIPALMDTELNEELADTLLSRRSALIQGGSASGLLWAGLSVGSIPMALAAVSTEAFAQGRLPAVVAGVLNFALRLEYLEADFYNAALAVPRLIPSADRTIFQTIASHENAHVTYLKNALGTQARAKPTFDFTASGAFPTVFSSYATFLTVAQAFEDTGVRAYKGQAAALIPYKAVLEAALSIHSVEARHASEVRRLRGNFMDQEPFQGWITLNQSGGAPAAVYAGEDNLVQLGINVTTVTTVAAKEIAEAFDEPLTQSQVLAIVGPFITA